MQWDCIFIHSFDQVSYEMAAWRGKDGEYTNYLEQNAASGQAYDYIVFKYNIRKTAHMV